VAKDGGSDWAGDKTDEEHRIRLQRAGQGVGLGKVQLGEDQAGDDAIDKKIVPLDGSADHARDNGAPQLLTVIGVRKGTCVNCRRGHRISSVLGSRGNSAENFSPSLPIYANPVWLRSDVRSRVPEL
jgi:hypothetical protein